MYVYKDFRYVEYVLTLDYEKGLAIYEKSVERFDDDRFWQAFINSGFDGNYDEYKKSIGYKPANDENENKMNEDEKIKEEARIIQKCAGIKDIIEDKITKEEKNIIAKEIVIEG